MDYNNSYKNIDALFGTKPNDILTEHYQLINPHEKVLDIGAGQGRNSFFLAQHGFAVDAIDPSQIAVNTITEIAKKESYAINARKIGFEDFNPQIKYSAILIFGLIQMLSWDRINLLLKKIDCWSQNDTLIFLTAWNVTDPRYEDRRQKWNEIRPNSFADSDGNIVTYLEADQILKLFPEYSVVYHWEGLGPWHRHGDSEPERHGSVAAVFRK